MRRFALLSLALFVCVMLVGNSRAQQTTGSLELRVVGEGGVPVRDAVVVLTSAGLQQPRRAEASAPGVFHVAALPVGVYRLEVSHAEFRTAIYEDVIVRLGRTTDLGSVTLVGRETEVVIVTAARPIIDPTSTVTGANLTRDELEVLPVERNYRSIALLFPQVDATFLGEDEPNFSGATGLENRYFVDGVDVTDPSRGATGTRLPYNFIKELQVKTGGYEAEYRGSLGGVINVVTHSGSNEFHSEAFGFFANNRIAGDPRQPSLQPQSGDFTLYDIGLGVGGPIVRDKLWFFAAYNPTFESQDVEVPGVGFETDESVSHLFSSKLTWNVSQRNALVLTLMGDPQERDAVGEFFGTPGTVPTAFESPDPSLAKLSAGGFNVSLRGEHHLNPRVFLESSGALITRRENLEAATEIGRTEPLFIDLQTGVWSGGFFSPVDNSFIQGTIGVTGTIFAGNHSLKAGVEYRDNRADMDATNHFIQRADSTTYKERLIFVRGRTHNRIPSAFVQDSWRVVERLRLNVGLRWDGQFLVGTDGNTAQSITDQYQPRVGLAYQPGEMGSQKIFASYGRFYQELSTYLPVRRYSDASSSTTILYNHDPRLDPSGGDTTSVGFFTIDSEVDLKGQYYDEIVLGYERRVARNVRVGIRGVGRTLGNAIEVGRDPEFGPNVGNPGGNLIQPEARRDYTALVLTAERVGATHLNFLTSYVFSKNYGNYPGLFNSDLNIEGPNNGGWSGPAETFVNGTGDLPNDRTHVFKAFGSYRWDFGFTSGIAFTWQSGTPLSERGTCSQFDFPCMTHLVQRGTAGRTPSIWDLSFRFGYDLPWNTRAFWRQRLILDVFHLGSQREAVNFDQIRTIDNVSNPTFGLPTRFQPPTAVRFGIEASF